MEVKLGLGILKKPRSYASRLLEAPQIGLEFTPTSYASSGPMTYGLIPLFFQKKKRDRSNQLSYFTPNRDNNRRRAFSSLTSDSVYARLFRPFT